MRCLFKITLPLAEANAAVVEPWFLAFNTKVEFHPAMNLEDLKNAKPGMDNAIRKYARAARAARA
jgi:hypothetical protein